MSANTLFNRAFAGINLNANFHFSFLDFEPWGISIDPNIKKVGLKHPITLSDLDVVGLVFNRKVYNELKRQIRNRSKDPWTKYYEKYKPLLTINGTPCYVKNNQVKACNAFYDKKILEIYLAGGLEGIAESEEADNGN